MRLGTSSGSALESAVDNSAQARAIARVLRGGSVSLPLGGRYGLAIAIFAVAVAARLAFLPRHGGLEFITFYPAVVLVALLLGGGPGLLTVFLSAAAALALFLPPFWVLDSAPVPIFAVAAFGASGVVICFLAQQMRRRTEQLHESENRFRALFDGAAVGQLLLEPSSLRILECNQAAADIFGCSRASLCTLRLADLDVGLGSEAAAAIALDPRADAKAKLETRVRRKDGAVRNVDVTVVPISSKEGDPYHATVVDITERKAAEQSLRNALRESEDLYQNAPCGYHSLDDRGVIIRINDTELKLLGYERAEVVGKMAARDLLSPESWARFEKFFPQFMKTGIAKDIEYEFKRKDGTLVSVVLSATAIRDPDGRYVLSRSTLNDITERKRAEAVQRRLGRSLRLLSECSIEVARANDEQELLDAVCRLIVSTGGYLMAWIGSAEHDAGKSIRPIARAGSDSGYLDLAPILWDQAAGNALGPIGAAIATRTTRINENCLNNPEIASWRAVAVQRGYRSSIALPLVIEGDALAALTMYASEPGAFTREEVALLEKLAREVAFGIQMLRTRAQHAESEKQLQASEARLHLALAATNLGMFDFDMVGRTLESDERARDLWGVGLNDLVSYETFKAGVHPDDWPAVEAMLQKALDPAGSGEYNIECRVKRRSDGAERYVLASGRFLFKDARATRSIGVVKDISAQKRLEREAQERRSELELISQQQVAVQTAAAIAHELNQPLVSICAYSETALHMLQCGQTSARELQHALQGAAEQAQRAGRTLHELLAFLQKGQARPELVDLNDLVREASAIAAQSSGGSLHPIIELEQNLRPVVANRLQVEKVLVNLLLNSMEAMSADGAALAPGAIKVKTMTVGNLAQVTVQDTGPGLEDGVAERIFDPFFTTKPHGMGLGLAISRALIEAHGGRLWSDLGRTQGAAFHFTLPFEP